MIICISGCPGTGKSTVAMNLACRLGIDQLYSTDVVRTILKSTKIKNPFLYTVTHEAWKIYGKKTKENMFMGFKKHCEIVCKHLEYAVEKSEEEGRDIILEGAHILPNYFKGYHFHLKVDDNTLLERYDLKNKKRTIPYHGWKNNFSIIKYINSKLKYENIIENYHLEKTLDIIENEIQNNK